MDEFVDFRGWHILPAERAGKPWHFIHELKETPSANNVVTTDEIDPLVDRQWERIPANLADGAVIGVRKSIQICILRRPVMTLLVTNLDVRGENIMLTLTWLGNLWHVMHRLSVSVV